MRKVKSATPRRVIGVGAHLPVFGRWARRWINHSVTHGQCDARPTVTFPAYAGTKFIQLGDRQLAAQDVNPIAYAPELTWPNFATRPGFEPGWYCWSGQRARRTRYCHANTGGPLQNWKRPTDFLRGTGARGCVSVPTTLKLCFNHN